MKLARRMLAAGQMGRVQGVEDANGSAPDKADLLTLGYALDAVPFVHVTGRANIDTLTLGYALDGVPFIGVSA